MSLHPTQPNPTPSEHTVGTAGIVPHHPVGRIPVVSCAGVMVTAVHAQTARQQGAPHLGPVSALWVKVLRGWGEHPSPTLPKQEISLLAHALTSMSENTVLQHPRVAVASTRSPPKLYVPKHKRRKNSIMRRNWLQDTRPSYKNITCKGGTSSTLTGQRKSTRRWGGWEVMECFSETIGPIRDTAESHPCK